MALHSRLHHTTNCDENNTTMSDNEDEQQHPELIIDEGFAALNNFRSQLFKKKDAGSKGDVKVADPIPRFPFASYAKALSMQSDTQRESFLNDCSVVFTARTKEDSEGYSTGETFFLPSLMKPRCALEALVSVSTSMLLCAVYTCTILSSQCIVLPCMTITQAQAVFRAHVDGLEGEEQTSDGKNKPLFDPERSGAEWWTLVLDTPSDDKPAETSESDEDDGEDDEIGMHFDADYGLEEQLPDYMLHPRVATITYLSDIGVPTLILDKRPPPPNDPEKKSLGGDINKGWLSHPSFGKHVAFDGRLLHGGPGEYFTAVKKESDSSEPAAKKAKMDNQQNGNKRGGLNGKRITFLVNVWLNHCPIDAEILDEDIVKKLTTVWDDGSESNQKKDASYIPPFQWDLTDVSAPDTLKNTTTLTKAPVESNGPAGEEEVALCKRLVNFKFGASMEDFRNANLLAAEEGSMQIEMKEGVLTLEVGEEVLSNDEEDGDEADE